jgi:hypothetical protein
VIPVTLTVTASQHQLLNHHLFPTDGCEAVAILLCGRAKSKARHRLVCRRVELVPYDACSVRLPDQVTWPTNVLLPLLDEATKNGWALVKIHGHRGFDKFSSVDDAADRQLFPSIYAWVEQDWPHGSCILMDDGRIFGRVVDEQGHFHSLQSVTVVGDDIVYYRSPSRHLRQVPEHGRRVAQTFGRGTYEQFANLRIGVIGCSGTGSPVIEQLARNGVGSLVLVDPDRIEQKNLNRILNATMDDAIAGRLKVDVARRAVQAMGLGTHIETHGESLFHRDVIRAAASCDVVFGCVDTIDGRYLLNKLASFYLIPYFDLGVKIEADGKGGVDQVCGSVHYLRPDGSSLLSRHVFTLEQVRAAGLHRVDPQQYRQQVEEGYIRGVQEDRPAVIQLNSLIASYAINELMARIHPYRLDPNGEYAVNRISVSHGIYEHESDGEPCKVIARHAGRGDVEPPLEWAELTAEKHAA